MLRYIGHRTLSAIALILIVSSLSLVLVRLAPGDALAGFEGDPAQAALERRRLGLDRPVAVQYVAWLGGVLRLDFGESLKYRRPVGGILVHRVRNTLYLGVAALLLATVIGVPAGVLTASRTGPVRAGARGVSLLLLSTPPLVTSFLLLLLAARTGWLPVGGFTTAAAGDVGLATIVSYLAVPALSLALPLAALVERLQSEAMTGALAEPCVHAARARGCSRRRAIWRHAFPLSLRPVLSIYGVIVGSALSGSLAVELVTAWPGLGALMYDALVARDFPLAAGCATAGTAVLAAGVLAADVGLAILDPRVPAGA
jgi:ABC-type dipeptide/oligopeptide/nickel transport system permease component